MQELPCCRVCEKEHFYSCLFPRKGTEGDAVFLRASETLGRHTHVSLNPQNGMAADKCRWIVRTTSAWSKRGKSVTDEKILMTLILDEDMAVTDAPCTGATVIAQYTDRYYALTITAGGTCLLGSEGEPPVSIGIRNLLDLVKATRAETLQ